MSAILFHRSPLLSLFDLRANFDKRMAAFQGPTIALVTSPECPRCRSTELAPVEQTLSMTMYSCASCNATVGIPR